MADMLVSIDLSGFSVGDFSRAQEIMDRGMEGTEKKKTLLSKFALNDSEWNSFTERRAARRKIGVPAPQFIAIKGLERPGGDADEKLDADLRSYFSAQIGKPLDRAFVEAQIKMIMGMGVFAHIAYAEVVRDGQPGLEIYLEGSTSRPPTVQPSIGIDGGDYLNHLFSLVTRFTVSDLGGFRSELRADLVLGNTYGFGVEHFRPFTPLSPGSSLPICRLKTSLWIFITAQRSLHSIASTWRVKASISA